jgi:uncharacterized protein YjdB
MLAFAAAFVVACGGDGSSEPPVNNELADSVATVVLTPSDVTVSVGATVTISVALRDSADQPVIGPEVEWISDRPTIARVDRGNVTGVQVGSAVVSATVAAPSGDRVGLASVTVVPASVANVIIQPGVVSVAVGRTVQLNAIVTDAHGNVLTGKLVTWSSTSPAAIVDDAGRVTGIVAGFATITATCDGRQGSASVTVTPG